MIRRIAVAVCGGLALLHVRLFAGQAWEGQLVEPALLLRWLLAGALAVGLIGVLRSGAPVFWSRRAVALWLLGALLHGPVVIDRAGADTQRLSEAAAIVVEIAVASAAVGAAFLFVAAAFRRTPGVRQVRGSCTHDLGPVVSPSHGFIQAFAPRPPPLK